MLIGEMISRQADLYGDKAAVKGQEGMLSYQELHLLSRRLGSALVGRGIRPGDRVGLLAENSLNFALAYLGVIQAGGTVVPINILFQKEEVSHILENSGARFLITTETFGELGVSVFGSVPGLEKLILPGREPTEGIEGIERWEDMLRGSEAALPGERNEEEVAAILYTSGTTGKPKGAMLTHHNLLSDVAGCAERLACNQSEVFLCVLPLFHSFAATVCFLLPLYLGATVVLQSRFHPGETLQLISKEGVTIFAGVPPMYTVWASMERTPLEFSSWRLAISGGAALPVEVMRKFEDIYQVAIIEGDGPTECSPVTSCNPPAGERKPGSIGIPLRGVAMKIVGENGRELARGEVGEITVRGPNVMKGYWANPQATQEAIKEGWFHTGDLGYEDEEGYFYIVDRKKDMVIVGGMNVYPREVEEVIYQHPAIMEAAVIGIPHRLRGEVVKGYVVLQEGKKATAREILDFCRQRLAAFKIPRELIITDSLPKTATGKILKRELVAREKKGKA